MFAVKPKGVTLFTIAAMLFKIAALVPKVPAEFSSYKRTLGSFLKVNLNTT
jgi:hypothetical protein